MNSAASRVNTTDYTFRLNVAKASWRKKAAELFEQARVEIANGEKNAAAVRSDATQNGVGAEQLRINFRDTARYKSRVAMEQAQAYWTRATGVGELEIPYGKDERNDVAFRSEYQELIDQARDLKLIQYGPAEQPLPLSSSGDWLD